MKKFASFLILTTVCIWSVCVEQSPLDLRQFDMHELDNGMKVLFITDPNVKESAAAMRIGVGSQQDPMDKQGLAHFLEHMLFIGSEDYPEVDQLQTFVAHHGGYTNAFTGLDKTQYYFSVNHDYFDVAIDMFTSFFTTPALDAKYIEREKNAVDSEFKMHLKNDGWRAFHVSNLTANQSHPHHRFTIGNLDTLVDGEMTLQEALRSFYETHYVGRNMYFVAVMPKDNTVLKAKTLEKLSRIERGKKSIEVHQPYLSAKEKATYVSVKTLANTYVLGIDFPVQISKQDYHYVDTSYISSLIGNESPGTMIDQLKENRLIEGFSVGSRRVSDSEVIVSFQIDMTELGYQNVDQVISASQQAIQLAKKQGIERWRFHEMQKIGTLSYLYQDNEDAMSQVNYYVSALSEYQPEELNKARFVTNLYQYDADRIEDALSQMQLENARIMLLGPDVETTEIDPYFGVEYQVEKLSNQRIQSWKKTNFNFELPKINRYLPEDIPSIKGESKPIEVASEHQNFRFWQMYDDTFKLPKVFTIAKMSKLAGLDHPKRVATLILAEMIAHESTREFYQANSAQNMISFSAGRDVLLIENVRWSGAPSLMPELLNFVNSYTKSMTESDFLQVKERLLREFKSRRLQPPFRLAESTVQDLVKQDSILDEEYEAILQAITFVDVQSVAKQLFSDLKVEAFSYGQLDQNSDLELLQSLVQNVEGGFTPVYLSKVVALENMNAVQTVNDHNDIAITHLYQAENNLHSYTIASLVSRLIQPGFFEDLRTEHQLGYIVYERFAPSYRVPFIKFGVQSPSHSCQDVDGHIARYIMDQESWLEGLSEEKVAQVKKVMLDSLQHPFTSMSSKYSFYSSEVLSQLYNFEIKEQLASLVQAVEKSDILDWWQQHMVKQKNQLKVSVNCEAELTDMSEFQSSLIYQQPNI
jgi:secreted Zn-dependent insulinase-like peptidase